MRGAVGVGGMYYRPRSSTTSRSASSVAGGTSGGPGDGYERIYALVKEIEANAQQVEEAALRARRETLRRPPYAAGYDQVVPISALRSLGGVVDRLVSPYRLLLGRVPRCADSLGEQAVARHTDLEAGLRQVGPFFLQPDDHVTAERLDCDAGEQRPETEHDFSVDLIVTRDEVIWGGSPRQPRGLL